MLIEGQLTKVQNRVARILFERFGEAGPQEERAPWMVGMWQEAASCVIKEVLAELPYASSISSKREPQRLADGLG